MVVATLHRQPFLLLLGGACDVEVGLRLGVEHEMLARHRRYVLLRKERKRKMEYFKAAVVMVFGLVYIVSVMGCVISWSEDGASIWDWRFLWGYGNLMALFLSILVVIFLALARTFSL
jgi:hypothetical protein